MDFEKQFSSETDCRSLIEHLKWPKGFLCKMCKNTRCWRLKCGRYACSKCRTQHYLLEGTLFQGTRKSLCENGRHEPTACAACAKKEGAIVHSLGYTDAKTRWKFTAPATAMLKPTHARQPPTGWLPRRRRRSYPMPRIPQRSGNECDRHGQVQPQHRGHIQ